MRVIVEGGVSVLADDEASLPPVVPDEWRARRIVRGDETEVVTGPISPVENDVDLIRQFGYDPDEIEIVGTINQWRKEQPDGTWLASYYFKHRPKTSTSRRCSV